MGLTSNNAADNTRATTSRPKKFYKLLYFQVLPAILLSAFAATRSGQ